MLKTNEESDPNSCLNKAMPFERLFILLARDLAAPDTIEYWIRLRVRLRLNSLDDDLMKEAQLCADLMRSERDAVRSQMNSLTRKNGDDDVGN